MNYEPNTEFWKEDAIVIHDADEKHPKMLMRIIGFTPEGTAYCRYVDRRRFAGSYLNGLQVLHAPERFGMKSEWGKLTQEQFVALVEEWEQVRLWNFYQSPGSPVRTTSADGGFDTYTTGEAFIREGLGYVCLERGGQWLLRFVEAIRAESR